jgi:hypothetical protein
MRGRDTGVVRREGGVAAEGHTSQAMKVIAMETRRSRCRDAAGPRLSKVPKDG